ncbi:hypothetical protein D3C86_1576580 [compost metagenome]
MREADIQRLPIRSDQFAQDTEHGAHRELHRLPHLQAGSGQQVFADDDHVVGVLDANDQRRVHQRQVAAQRVEGGPGRGLLPQHEADGSKGRKLAPRRKTQRQIFRVRRAGGDFEQFAHRIPRNQHFRIFQKLRLQSHGPHERIGIPVEGLNELDITVQAAAAHQLRGLTHTMVRASH